MQIMLFERSLVHVAESMKQHNSEDVAIDVKAARPKSAIQKAVEDKLLQLSQRQSKNRAQENDEIAEDDDDVEDACTSSLLLIR